MISTQMKGDATADILPEVSIYAAAALL